MSIQEDQELRQRLDMLLSDIEPRPAPVALAMRQGKGIRMRRWGAAAIGFAFVAGGAAVLPAVLHTARSAPSPNAALRYSVTVHSPGKNARPGLIAYGTQDGNRWSVVISGRGANESVVGTGTNSIALSAAVETTPAPVAVVSVGGGQGGGLTIVGAVAGQVTTVAMTLPGDRVFALKPVRYLDQRFVAIVIPAGVPIVRAAAYEGSRELAYSVPYDRVSLVSWWRPGQATPARLTETIAAGRADGLLWRYVAQFGPWGYCYAGPGGSDCMDGANLIPRSAPRGTVAMMSCGAIGNGSPGNPTSVLASVPVRVRQVALRFSGGSTDRVGAVGVGGASVIGYLIPAGQHVLHATMYGTAGRTIGTTQGFELSCVS
jgi:hypothetical protein